MILAEQFLLRTTWGTVLCRDPSTGALRHGLPDEGCEPHVLRSSDAAVSFEDALSAQIEVRESDNAVCLNVAGRGYLSALSDGTFETRGRARAWERFAPVTVSDYLTVRIQDRPPKVPRWPVQNEIPKTIHQVFFGASLHQTFVPLIEDLRSRNPDYAYRLWRDDDAWDLIRDSYGLSIAEQFERIVPEYGAARADLFRYLLIYRLGGVYLDIKSSVRGRLSDIIPAGSQFLLSQWSPTRWPSFGRHALLAHVPGGEFQQWHVIAAPGHPFLERVIDRVLKNIWTYDPARNGVGMRGVLRLAGPIPFSLAIAEVLDEHPHTRFCSEEAGLIYRAARQARGASGRHYSELRLPVVRPQAIV